MSVKTDVDYVEWINRLFTVPESGSLLSVVDGLTTSVEAAAMQGYIKENTASVTLKRLEELHNIIKLSEQ